MMDYKLREINYESDDDCWLNDSKDIITKSLKLSYYRNEFLINDSDPLLCSSEENEMKKIPEFDLKSLHGWMIKPIEEWNSEDVLSWISSEAKYFGVMMHEMQAHNFVDTNGNKLKQMCKDDFYKFSRFGYFLYYRFQQLIVKKDRSFNESLLAHSNDNSTTTLQDNSQSDYCSTKNLDEHLLTENQNSDLNSSCNLDSGFESESDIPPEAPVIKNKRGRPKGSYKKDKPVAKEKTTLVWEFIRDLLLNPAYCPSIVCWDRYEDGVFRVVDSYKMAKLWGIKKNNLKMNYEKLSRAMRYNYNSKFLEEVCNRNLVFKFGPRASGWRIPNTNLS